VSLSDRLLNPESLPATLWDKEEKFLLLPVEFAAAYERLIDRYGLRTLATSRSEQDSPIGGVSKAEADQHFAQQFDNSAARAQLALTNVTGDLIVVSNALIRALGGNSICLTDAPCGAGAATYAFLCAIAELRAQSVLPARCALDVRLIGAEISGHARAICGRDAGASSAPILESQALSTSKLTSNRGMSQAR
jgi:hypothetical protein